MGFIVFRMVIIIKIMMHCYALEKNEVTTYGHYEFGQCPLEGTKYRTILNLSIRDCVRNCALRSECFAVGYHRRRRTCSLHIKTDEVLDSVTNPHYIQVRMDTVNVTQWRGKCQCHYWRVCNTDTGKCESEIKLCEVTNDVCIRGAYKFGYCHNEPSTSYTKQVSNTVNGFTCQRWDQQTPHAHNYTDINEFPDASFSDAANYCRDPNSSGKLWCFTMNPGVEKEACLVTKCKSDYDPDECYRFDEAPVEYKGQKNITINGRQCQFWNSEDPHSHYFHKDTFFPEKNITEARNYCRDLDSTGHPWCYTTIKYVRWEACDISVCP